MKKIAALILVLVVSILALTACSMSGTAPAATEAPTQAATEAPAAATEMPTEAPTDAPAAATESPAEATQAPAA